MRSLSRFPTLLATAALLGVSPLAAQLPDAPAAPAPAAHSVWFDAGALTRDQIRGGAEVVALGRFTFGFSISYALKPHPRDVGLLAPYVYDAATGASVLPQCDPRMLTLCVDPYYPYGYGAGSRYRAWVFDLAARYYPAAVSFRNGVTRMMLYGGAFAGYHWRTWDQEPYYYPCYAYPCPLEGTRTAAPPAPSPADSVVPLPPYGSTYPIAYWGPIRHILKGLEPGVEIGVRLLPIGPLYLEAGGRFTLAVVDDPMQRIRPGDVDARLVLAAGIAW